MPSGPSLHATACSSRILPSVIGGPAMAGAAIDRLADPSAPVEEQQERKHTSSGDPENFATCAIGQFKREIGVGESHVLYFALPEGRPHKVSISEVLRLTGDCYYRHYTVA